MSLKGALARGGAILGAVQVSVLVLRLVRSIVVARLVSPGDYGIAATFALTLSLLEMVSDLGPNQLLLQAPDGDRPEMQESAQALQFLRGLGMGAVLLALADAIAGWAFQTPQAAWAFRWLALVPVLRGLGHMDPVRMQRDLRFGAHAWATVSGQIAATTAAWPLAWWCRDYSAMLWITVTEAAVTVAAGHLLSERSYRWSWRRDMFARFGAFGWPLLVNGLVMYLAMSGDRVAVGRLFGMEALGAYTVAFSLASLPASFIGSISVSLFLPVLAKVKSEPELFGRRYAFVSAQMAAVAICVTIPLILLGGVLVKMLYGLRYAEAGVLAGWLGAAHGLRILRMGSIVGSLAMGDSRNSMFAGAMRVPCLVLAAVLCFAVDLPLIWFPVFACAGEALGLVYSAGRLHRRYGVLWVWSIAPATIGVAAMALGGLVSRAVVPTGSIVVMVLATAMIVVCGCSAIVIASLGRRQDRWSFLQALSRAFHWAGA